MTQRMRLSDVMRYLNVSREGDGFRLTSAAGTADYDAWGVRQNVNGIPEYFPITFSPFKAMSGVADGAREGGSSETKKGRVVQIFVNGALLSSLNTRDAVAVDYLLFLEGVINALMKDKDSLEKEANNSGRTIKGHGLSFIGSVSIPEVADK